MHPAISPEQYECLTQSRTSAIWWPCFCRSPQHNLTSRTGLHADITYAAMKAVKMSQSAKISIFPAMSSMRAPVALIRLAVSHAILLHGGHSKMKQKD